MLNKPTCKRTILVEIESASNSAIFAILCGITHTPRLQVHPSAHPKWRASGLDLGNVLQIVFRQTEIRWRQD